VKLRLRSGARRKAESGGYAYGRPKFGFRAEGKQLVPDADEQATIARIGELRSEGHSIRSIASTLEAEGHANRGSARWHPTMVARIVKRLAAS
jgi:hypothetical protein